MKLIVLLGLGTAALGIALPLAASPPVAGLTASGTAIAATSAPVAAPAVIAQTSRFAALTINPGQLPAAPDGKTLTLTVDGVELPVAPGTYAGNVVLTVSDDIPVTYHEMPTHHFRTAVYIDNGRPVPARSVSAAVGAGTVADSAASVLRIASRGSRFNGIIAAGSGTYTVDRPFIDLTGNGGNDFAGFGAAIMSTDKAELTVNRPVIRTHGAIRTALFVGGESTMRVNDAEIEVFNGRLPADYKFTVEVGKMMEVPWMLGLSGNVRAVNLVGKGKLYINRSHIRAQGWGVLSTDDAQSTRMEVRDSVIEAVESGYGTYSIGDSHNRFIHSIIDAADIGGVIAGEASLTFTEGSIVKSRRYGVMMHSGLGGGTLTIDKGSLLSAAQTAIQIKGRGTTIVVDDAAISAGNGIIVQAMENDDPFMKAMMRGEMPAGMGPPPPGTEQMLPGAGAKFSPDVIATFRHTQLVGNFFNGRTSEGDMTLHFEDAGVTGILSTSTVAAAGGKEPTAATYREIGNVVNTPAPSATAKGLAVTLDGKSRWTVTGTSYLTGLTIAPGAVIAAPGGRRVQATLNGKPVRLRPGTLRGAITISVN